MNVLFQIRYKNNYYQRNFQSHLDRKQNRKHLFSLGLKK